MSRIEHLNISITDLPPDALMSKILSIRANRRTRPLKKKPNAQAKRTVARRKKPQPQDAFALLDKMSTKQKAALLAQLTEKK